MNWIDFKKEKPKFNGKYLIWYNGAKYTYHNEWSKGSYREAYWVDDSWCEFNDGRGHGYISPDYFMKVSSPAWEKLNGSQRP